MANHTVNHLRGLLTGCLAGSLAFAVPWLLLGLLLAIQILGVDLDPAHKNAWLGSYFLTSIVASAAYVSFATSPGSTVRQDFRVVCLIVTLVAILCPLLAFLGQGPRYKSQPPFGEKHLDLVLLTMPAVVASLVILAWRSLRPGHTLATREGNKIVEANRPDREDIR